VNRPGQERFRRVVRGFTLIELMVVLVIVGVMITFVTLSVDSDPRDKELATEASRLAALVELASEEAILRSSQLAIRFTETDYAFFAFLNGQWQPVENDPQFRQREMPDGMSMSLTLDEAPPFDLTAEEDEQPPQVFLLSSGEMTPFTVEFSAEESQHQHRVRATLTGALTVESL
jgi:general secretion pathway protein H